MTSANKASLIINKYGTYYFGIGDTSANNEIMFGHVGGDGSWVNDNNLKIIIRGDVTAKRLSLNGGSNYIEWDATNNAYKVNGNIYATGGVSALGFNFLSATEVSVGSLSINNAVFTVSGSEIYVTIGSTQYKLTKTIA